MQRSHGRGNRKLVTQSLFSFAGIAVFAVWGIAQEGPLKLTAPRPAAPAVDTARKKIVTGLRHEDASVSAAVDPHAAVFAASDYPSASECSTCHEAIYNEWSSSSHAYASVSPVFHKFEQRINDLSQGTIGSFCVRCHAGPGTTMNESRAASLAERSQVGREGITCISCHRVNERYGRVNGERRIEPGNIFSPVYGSTGGEGVAAVVSEKDRYRVKTNAGEAGPGQNIHATAIKFEQIDKSEFCVSCHQVAVHPGIKLEVVWDQYRASPARADGVSCQDCHMGKSPGIASGYATGPAAVVAGVAINPTRKRTNHQFYGPGYPTAHPGIFPHNPKAERWTAEQWLKFDYRAGWGTKAFEDKLTPEQARTGFPDEWKEPDDRYDAREIVDANLASLERKRSTRREVMENGSHLDGPFFDGDPRAGQALRFNYRLTNTNPGHNLPSGSLGAQPELWLNVALIDPDGKKIWESGYLDSNGDMADQHSLDVRAGKIPFDDQLFNLQTKFLTTNVKGTDREMYLPINLDIDQLPFIRPAGQPITVLNHPPFIRMEGRSIPPLGSRDAKYSVPGNLITKPGTYKLAVRMRSRAEPIYFMRFIRATTEMERTMNEWMVDLHPYTVEFAVR
jgi:nitrate/TMAO reductase-like tetraheme cytochrome c subunit